MQRLPTLQALGYRTTLSSTIPIPAQTSSALHPTTTALSTYTITPLTRAFCTARLSILDTGTAASTNTEAADADLLIIHTLTLETTAAEDSRPAAAAQRPRARTLVASFWVHQVARPLATLRRIRFRTVVEPSTRDVVRDRVCVMLGVGYDYIRDAPCSDVLLCLPKEEDKDRKGKEKGNAREAWALVCERSRLVRCVRGMMKEYHGQAGLEVVEIEIIGAYDKHGVRSMFDMNLVLGCV